MKTLLVLTLCIFASSAHAQYPYQYSYPTRLGWSYQAWALANDTEYVRRLPDHNDSLHKMEMLSRIRMQKEMADYYLEQSRTLRAARQSEESGPYYANPYKKRLYENPYR